MDTKQNTIKKSFPVTGMSCASCAVSVESMLKAQEGVVNAVVNFANKTAMVEYIPAEADTDQFKKAIQSIGYDLITGETAEAKEDAETVQREYYHTLRRRTIWSVVFSVPLVIIGMFLMDMPYANYLMWALASPVVILFGRQFFIGAWKQALHRSANMDTLIAMGTGIAYVFSVFNTLYPAFWTQHGLHADVYFEASAVVITFILLGKVLEEKAKANTSSAIKKLMGLQPDEVTCVYEGYNLKMPLAQVKKGDVLLVKPGERIAVDGRVTEGNSYVDESMISGEPIPVLKEKGVKVFSGTINQKGSFQFVTEKVGSDTLLAHIIQTVQEAQGSKAPVQKLVDKIAGIFVPVVIVIAILSLIIWSVWGGDNGFSHGLLAMVSVLVVACPCALGLATPTAIMVGVGKGASHGILIKDAESLEQAYKVNAMVLDKTGTITVGKPEVVDIAWLDEIDSKQHAEILRGMEMQSEHPLAGAVNTYLEKHGDGIRKADGFESITGKGVVAMYEGHKYFAGSAQLLQEKKVTIAAALQRHAGEWLKSANTVIWFADEDKALAAIAIADKIKDSSVMAVQDLKQQGIDVYMLTGDNAQTAKAVAAKAGISHYEAEMQPSAKADFVKKLQAQGKVVAMAGDGINDSEALAQADVSIAMGKGADIAMDVAKMTLLSSDLAQLPKAMKLSGKTVQLIRQNLFWAFIYNVISIPIAAGLLYPFTGFLLNPMIAGAAMALSSVSVVSNSLRLKWAKL